MDFVVSFENVCWNFFLCNQHTAMNYAFALHTAQNKTEKFLD